MIGTTPCRSHGAGARFNMATGERCPEKAAGGARPRKAAQEVAMYEADGALVIETAAGAGDLIVDGTRVGGALRALEAKVDNCCAETAKQASTPPAGGAVLTDGVDCVARIVELEAQLGRSAAKIATLEAAQDAGSTQDILTPSINAALLDLIRPSFIGVGTSMFAGHDPLDFGTVCKVHRFLYTMACDFAAIGFTTSRVDLRRGGKVVLKVVLVDGELPSGITLEPGTGRVHGEIARAHATGGPYKNYTATLAVQDPTGLRSESATLTIKVYQETDAKLDLIRPTVGGASDLGAVCQVHRYKLGCKYQLVFGTPRVGPLKVVVVSGELPGGVTLDNNTGALHGEITLAHATDGPHKDYEISLVVQDPTGLQSKPANLTVKVYVETPAKLDLIRPRFDRGPNFGTVCKLHEWQLGCTFLTAPFQTPRGLAPLKVVLVKGELPGGIKLDPGTGRVHGAITVLHGRSGPHKDYTVELAVEDPTGLQSKPVTLTIKVYKETKLAAGASSHSPAECTQPHLVGSAKRSSLGTVTGELVAAGPGLGLICKFDYREYATMQLNSAGNGEMDMGGANAGTYGGGDVLCPAGWSQFQSWQGFHRTVSNLQQICCRSGFCGNQCVCNGAGTCTTPAVPFANGAAANTCAAAGYCSGPGRRAGTWTNPRAIIGCY